MAVAGAIAGGFAAVLSWHDRLPIAVTVLVLAILGGWYNSLQHEVIHDHPTRWRGLNTALAIVPLGLVVRFPDYRDSHLAHHRSPALTDPDLDPESFYVSAETWRRWGPIRRALQHGMRTLGGRLTLGPLVFAARHWRSGFASASRAGVARRVIGHALGVAAVLLVVRSSGVPIWAYVLGATWGGGSLSLLRSFAEHRYTVDGTRSAVVRSGWFFSLLFLNNNLHHSHHARPWVPWFGLPAVYVASDDERDARAGAGWYRGYGELARRFLLRPFDQPVAGPTLPDDAADAAWPVAPPASPSPV